MMLLPRQATPQMTQQEHKPLKLEADEDGQLSPLFAAAWGGDVTAAEKALDAGEAVNARDADAAWTALTFAAFQGHTAVAELLLARGADVDSKTTDDATPLMLAVGLTVPGLDPGLIHQFLSSVNVNGPCHSPDTWTRCTRRAGNPRWHYQEAGLTLFEFAILQLDTHRFPTPLPYTLH